MATLNGNCKEHGQFPDDEEYFLQESSNDWIVGKRGSEDLVSFFLSLFSSFLLDFLYLFATTDLAGKPPF